MLFIRLILLYLNSSKYIIQFLIKTKIGKAQIRIKNILSSEINIIKPLISEVFITKVTLK